MKTVLKRDKSTVSFNPEKIKNAVSKALEETREDADPQEITNLVADRLRKLDDPIDIEKIQDTIEQVLFNLGLNRTARAYILYREDREKIRQQKRDILNKDILDHVDKAFDVNAINLIKSRYIGLDETGKPTETLAELFERIAINAVLPEIFWSGGRPGKLHEDEEGIKIGKYELNKWHMKTLERLCKRNKVELVDICGQIDLGLFDYLEERIQEFYNIMVTRRYMPNTPTIANYGRNLGLGSACFVLDIEDSIQGIMSTLGTAAEIFKYGGGVGYNFSKLRPKGAGLSSTNGTSSGPVSFITLFDKMTDVIKQGGIRRGANMGIMDIKHPDIEEFITAKKDNKQLTNFNISVLVYPEFIKACREDKDWDLIDPHTQKVVKTVRAQKLLNLIVHNAWADAEPGILFYDHVNDVNPLLEEMGPIVTTNPCGEVLLYPNEPCNLGSINLVQYVNEAEFDWSRFEHDIYTAMRFLDNVVEANYYPLNQIEETSLKTRKVGLGVMGFSEVLVEMLIPYDSEEGLELAEEIAQFMAFHARRASNQLAQERGSFPLFEGSSFAKGILPFNGDTTRYNKNWQELKNETMKGTRNTFATVIAPTGSISMLANCQSGIEPIYALVFEKRVAVGNFEYIVESFKRRMMKLGLWNQELFHDVMKHEGSIQHLSYIPKDIKRVFKVASEIPGEWHVKMQAAWQKWVDSSISKTINLPSEATEEEVRNVYLMAYDLKCKDVTVFRDQSISGQVYNKVCPECQSPLMKEESCLKCTKCQWSSCQL